MTNTILYPSSYNSILNPKGNKGKSYQQKAVSNLYSLIEFDIKHSRQLNLETQDDENYQFHRLLLQAPTGSGKTIMAGALVDLLNENHKDIVYLWICETPNLTNQSKKKFEKVFDLTCYEYGDTVIRDSLPANTITCVNWEKLKSTKINEDNEQQKSIKSLIDETREQGLYLIVLIDEAHSHATSKLSQDFLNDIKPNLVLDVTATPTDKVSYYKKHTVKIEDVKQTGFIKQGVVINAGIGIDVIYNEEYQKKNEVEDLGEFILNESINKKDELKIKLEEYAKKKNKELVNPLLVVQMPNSNDELMSNVESFFNKKGYSRGNGKLAVYTSKDYTDELDAIGKDEKVEVLLFKQAISKGWDCPRASILTFIRNPKSQILTTQTIGRIMRMPYLEKYSPSFDVLNYGYIYIESTDNSLIQEYQQEIDKATGAITILRKGNITTHFDKLKRTTWMEEPKTNKMLLIKETIKKINWSRTLNLEPIDETVTTNIFSDSIDVKDLSEKNSFELKSVGIELKDITDIDIQNKVDKLLKEYKIQPSIVKETIRIDLKHSNSYKTIRDFQLIILNNLDLIREEINKVENSIKIDKKVVLHEFVVPQVYNTKELKENDETLKEKSMYQKVQYRLNGLEEKFISFVHDNKNVIRWHRNGEQTFDHFCIAYRHGNDTRHFYPDFLIETDSTVYIIDTKGDLTKEDGHAKYAAMKSYEDMFDERHPNFGKKLKVGYVKEHNDKLYMYNGNDLAREYMELSKWTLLSFE